MRYYVVDAFAGKLFTGNPAGVCVLNGPLEASLMQSVAAENNLPETAFFYRDHEKYRLRWFTPVDEIDLCGHATLASAYVIFRFLDRGVSEVHFLTLSGELTVVKDGDVLTLDFPSRRPVPCAVPEGLEDALGVKILEAHSSRDMLCLVESEAVLKSIQPDYQKLRAIPGPLGFVVTAKSETYDFVSRFFAPGTGIDEDPVTGSTHTNLIPFWSERLGKTKMTAAQLSKRGGVLFCEDCGTRVRIGGRAVCYLQGELLL